MSLLCFKNCRDSAMLLGMPTDQLMKKKVFNEKKQKHPQEKSSEQNSEIGEDPPYLPWDDKQSDLTKDREAPKMVTRKEEDVAQSSSSSWGRIDSPVSSKSRSRTYDSDEFSHVNVYSKKVMAVVDEDQGLSNKKDENDNPPSDGSISGLFSKFGRSISSLLKRSDSKKVKDTELEQSRANTTSGYDAGESASETLSVLSEARFWSMPYEERRSGEERYGIQSPTIQQIREKHALDESNFSNINSLDYSIMANRRSSLDSGYAFYMGGRHDGFRLRGSPPIGYGSDGVDTPDGSMRTNGTGGLDSYGGNMRMNWSPSNGSITEGSLNRRHWSMREPRTSPRRRAFSSADRTERKYASTGNLTDYSLSSADSNRRRSGSFTRYRSPESVKWPNSSSRMDSFTSTPRRNKSYEIQVTKTKRDYGMSVSPISNSQKQSPSNRMEADTRNTLSHYSDSSNITLNLDFDYKAESSRLYVILKSMHGLTPKGRTAAKTNVRVHLIVMPERAQRAYTRRKNEGWTVRFMEKFRFSDINTLNSIAFKVVLNDGSAKERLVGTKAVYMKELILSKGKHSLTIEINKFNFDTQ